MPWKVSHPVDERAKFVVRLERGERMTDLCQEYGISRKTGYKFLERFRSVGTEGLFDRSRAPRQVQHRLSEPIQALLVAARTAHPSWGPKKLKRWLEGQHPGVTIPAASSIGDLLKRKGLVQTRRRRHTTAPDYGPLTQPSAPNDVWCIDYKGQFRLGNGKYCYPLTVTDQFSRFIIVCDAFEAIAGAAAQASLEAAFRTHGLPAVIRSDNGTPFASRGLAGLSQLSVWWRRLGIKPERIEPAEPQQNGRHERMHRTLKAETTRPAAANLLQQQERFDAFVEEFNNERPHEALDQRPPATVYDVSSRLCPEPETRTTTS